MPSIQANGISLEYSEQGRPDDPVIVLVMGLGTQMVAWPDSLSNGLASLGFRVVLFDNRDVGLSSDTGSQSIDELTGMVQRVLMGAKTKPPYTLDDMAADTVGLMDALSISRAHIVGISMGGMISQLVAAQCPERVESLTLIMTSSGNPELPPGKPEALAALFSPRPGGNDREAIVAHTMKTYRIIGSPGFQMSDADLRAWVERSADRAYRPAAPLRHLLAVLSSGDRREVVKRITCPTLVMHGIDDPLVPIEAGRELAAIIPGAQSRFVPGMGHDLAESLMPIWIEAISTHCRSVSPDGRTTPARTVEAP
jgi:pimeloyl-ACP methyl ester carboxylesterase